MVEPVVPYNSGQRSALTCAYGLHVMSEEEIVCRVRWIPLWKSVSIYGTITVTLGIFAVIAVRFYKLDFDFEKTFEHLSPLGLLAIPFIVAAAMSLLFLPIALFCTLGKIRIKNGVLSGRNYWFMKKRIPMGKVTHISRFSEYGINAFVAHSEKYGKVYISDHTENLEVLIETILSHLPEEQRNIT